MTTKDLIKAHNDLAEQFGLPPLNGWKASKEALQAKIDGLVTAPSANPLDLPQDVQEPSADVEPDTAAVSGAEETTDEPVEPEEAPVEAPSTIEADPDGPALPNGKGIGAMVRELLLDEAGFDYPTIVEAVRREFPRAKTSTRSVASVAAQLRRDGAKFPMRRKPRSAKA